MPELSAGMPAPVIRKTGRSLKRPSKMDIYAGKFGDSTVYEQGCIRRVNGVTQVFEGRNLDG